MINENDSALPHPVVRDNHTSSSVEIKDAMSQVLLKVMHAAVVPVTCCYWMRIRREDWEEQVVFEEA